MREARISRLGFRWRRAARASFDLLAVALLACVIPLRAGAEGIFPDAPLLRLETGMHTATIWRIDVDATERYLASGSDDKTVRVWGLKDGRLLNTLRLPIGPGNLGKVFSVAISPDGQTVAVGGWTAKDGVDTNLFLFDRESGALEKRITDLPNVILHLAFSKDGRHLAASLGRANGIRVYETGGYTQVAQDSDYGGNSLWADFDASGRLVTTSKDGHVRIYDARFRLLRKVQAPGGAYPFSAAFSPDGDRIAVGYQDTSRVDVLSAEDLGLLYSADTADTNSSLDFVAWSRDGRFLYAGGQYNKGGWDPIRRWRDGGRGEFTEHRVALNTIFGLEPLSDGRLAVGAADPLLAVLGPDGEEAWKQEGVIAVFRGQLGANAILLSARGDVVRFGFEQQGERPARFSLAEGQLELDPANDPALRGPVTQGVPGLEVTDWEDTTSPKLNDAPLSLKTYETSRSLAIAPGGQKFLLGTEWYLRLFDRGGDQLWRVDAPGIAWAVNISGDGRLAVVGYGDGTIRWHRMSDGQELLAVFPHRDGKRWIAWTPTGYYQASVGGEELIGWHVNRGAERAAEFFSAARFRDSFYRPDVVARVLETLDEEEALRLADEARGQRTITRDVRGTRPPTVGILAPASGSPVAETRLTLMYEAQSETGAITGIEARVAGRPAQVLDHHPTYRSQNQQVIGQMTVEIPASDTVVSLIARNEHGASEPAEFVVNWTGGKDWYKPNLYVLAVGVSDYDDDTLDLRFAAKDAKDFLAAIEGQKERGLYRSVTTRLLDDKKATHDAILDGLDWLERQTGSRDVAIFFLAGHGLKDPVDDKYRFLPHDADRGRLRRTTVKDADFKEFLGAVAGKTLMFQDTCFSGKLLSDRRPGDTQADVDRLANELAEAETGVIVFSSSTGRQLSQESEDWANGAFTKALVEGIREDKADFTKDLHVSVAELEVYLSDRVIELTKGEQKPVTAKPTAIEDLRIVRLRR
jgi:hypothetical protein